MRVKGQSNDFAGLADDFTGSLNERNVAQVNSIEVPDGDGRRLQGSRGHMHAHRWQAKWNSEPRHEEPWRPGGDLK